MNPAPEDAPFKTLSADQAAELMRRLHNFKEALFSVAAALAEPEWLERLQIDFKSLLAAISYMEDAGCPPRTGIIDTSEALERFIAAIRELDCYHSILREYGDGQFVNALAESLRMAQKINPEIRSESH